jgi:hypothetical protein
MRPHSRAHPIRPSTDIRIMAKDPSINRIAAQPGFYPPHRFICGFQHAIALPKPDTLNENYKICHGFA